MVILFVERLGEFRGAFQRGGEKHLYMLITVITFPSNVVGLGQQRFVVLFFSVSFQSQKSGLGEGLCSLSLGEWKYLGLGVEGT